MKSLPVSLKLLLTVRVSENTRKHPPEVSRPTTELRRFKPGLFRVGLNDLLEVTHFDFP